MSNKRKSYCDWSNPSHIEAMEAAGEKAEKLHSAQTKVQDAYEMLKLVQQAEQADAEIMSLAVSTQIYKILPLLKSALRKLDRHSIDHTKLAFTHCLGGAK